MNNVDIPWGLDEDNSITIRYFYQQNREKDIKLLVLKISSFMFEETIIV